MPVVAAVAAVAQNLNSAIQKSRTDRQAIEDVNEEDGRQALEAQEARLVSSKAQARAVAILDAAVVWFCSCFACVAFASQLLYSVKIR